MHVSDTFLSRRSFLGTLIFLLLLNSTIAQVSDPDYFAPPVKIPMLLTGNFGELRSNHFHSGIDIKTQGRTGLPVYSAAEGFLSRIFVSPGGFGLALYIEHPNGTTTVYGHLLKLRDDLQAYLREAQYDDESFAVDLSVPRGKFVFKKGDLIAYSGNSGSSGGPHVHFEIRDTDTEKPLNPLLWNFGVKDVLPPTIQSVMLYPLSDNAHVSGKSYPQRIDAVLVNGVYHLKSDPVLNVYGEIGFGVQALDYLTGSWNKCGVYEINLLADNKPVTVFRVDQLRFEETRYINSHIDYAHYRKYNRRLHKSWIEPGNRLSNYPVREHNGRINLSDGKVHEIKYLIKDVYGNESRLAFNVTSKPMPVTRPKEAGIPVFYNKTFSIDEEGIEAEFESGTFYADFSFDFKKLPSSASFYSPLFKLHHDQVPVHQYYELKIKPVNLPSHLREKALIAAVDPKTGQKWSLGGGYSFGWIEANVRQLGHFAVTVDTIAPTITPLNIQNNTLSNRSKISFKIRDELSGINSYRGELNGKWILFEYDAKNNLIEYYFDTTRVSPGKIQRLKLIVADAKGNKKTYETSFSY
ncbi:MAG: M23 family metallopeptidase [Prolixibacteraceae bacterium]